MRLDCSDTNDEDFPRETECQPCSSDEWAPAPGAPSFEYLPRCQKHHFGAYIQDRQMLIVWNDYPKNLLGRAARVEESLMKIIWRDREQLYEKPEEKEIASVLMV